MGFKSWATSLAGLVLAIGLAKTAQAQAPAAHAPQLLKVGTAGTAPYADILKFAVDHSTLKQQGIDVQIVTVTDFVQLNSLTEQKQLDANFFQHWPYLDQSNHDGGTHVVPVKAVFTSMFGAYSRRWKRIQDLPDGALIVFPNDPANSGRALAMFADHGLITLRPGAGIKATEADIAGNPHHYKFREVEQLMLTRTLDDADLVAINAAYVLQLGLSPARDSLIAEKIDRFPSGLAARADNQNGVAMQALARALVTPEVRQFITMKFGDSVKPLF